MTVININVKSTVVPLTIGGLDFEMHFTDEVIEGYESKLDDIQNKAVNYEEKTLADAKEFQKEAFDWVLGEGAYDKLYKKFPSTIVLTDVLKQVFIEFQKRAAEYTGVGNDVQARYDAIIEKKKTRKK